MKEQRSYVRYNIFVEDTNSLSCSYKGRSIDISDISYTGIGLCLNERLSVGDKVDLEINVPMDDIPMFVTAEVAWVAKDVDMENVYRTGLSLSKISSSDKSRLLRYLNRCFPVV
jgi:hypothetical protein